MGWGARVTRNALVEFPEFKVAAFIHPSFWKIEDAFQMIQKPLLLVVSQDEDDMIPYYNVLKDRLGEDNCAHHRFDDIHHGFAGARGDLNQELNRRRVDQTLDLVRILNKNMTLHKNIYSNSKFLMAYADKLYD
ncbi:unnamed protein product [Allacma fusca]|uniref:Dienelactone hydrolase domain-containing protein n=1 Tax=Allacma fusca TaxID=39272 RepID=A0A8J2PFK3_9HEXA|nr:unnamed protein product [Allacma fusca]